MGRLIYTLNVSLDGFVETLDHSTHWRFDDDELLAWFADRARGLAASLYGRRLYELMSAYWPTAQDDPAATEAHARLRAPLAGDPQVRLLIDPDVG